MQKIPKIILLIEGDRGFGRELLSGIAKYSRLHGPWSFYREPPFFRDLGRKKKILHRIKNWGADGIVTRLVAEIEETIKGADLIVTATGKLLEPIYQNAWVKEGALVLPVHTQGWDSSTPSKMDKLVVDDWTQYRTIGDILYQPLPEKPHAETGEIVAGIKPGRENSTERIVNFNKGLAIHDILMASFILDKAKEKGLGTELSLQKPGEQLPMLDV